MNLELIKLIVVFLVIIVFIALKRKLGEAITAALLATIVLYRIPFVTAIRIAAKSVIEKDTLIVLASFILVMFLQRIMEFRKLLQRAELALKRISGNRRVVCILAPVIIGFLPSAGAVTICGEIVNDTIGKDLSVEERTFVTSYYRHISESFSPTYNTILLALSITAVNTGSFVLAMIPLVAALLFLGYLFYLRKIESKFHYNENEENEYSKKEEWKQLLYCFWPLVACIVIVVMFNVSVLKVLPVIILVSAFVYRLTLKEIIQYAKLSFEKRIIINTIILMIFKNLLTYTGIISELPNILEKTPLPAFLSFGIIMLFGTIISGATAMAVLILPIAFETVIGSPTALLVYLMAISYAAMQISPTHICLAVVTEYFNVDFGKLIWKTMPVICCFLVLNLVYYLILNTIL